MAGTDNKDELIAELDEILGWGVIAAPFAVLLAFSPLNLDCFGLPKVTALYLVTLFLVYFQVRRWFISGSIDIPIEPILLPIGALLLVAGVTAMLSANPLASLFGRSSRYESLLALICYATILWFSLKIMQDEDGFRRRFTLSFTLVFFLINIYGLLEMFGLDVMSYVVKADGRVSSTIGNPIFFGGFLAMSLPVLLAKALSPPQEAKQVWDNPVITLGLICLGIIMLFSTLSRGAWLGTAVAFLVVLYFRIKGRQKLPLRVLYWIPLIVSGIALGIFLVLTIGDIDASHVVDAVKSPGSLENRVEIWKSSLRMISDRPLFGYGLDQTEDWFSHYTTQRLARLENALHDRAHNIYLQMAIDGGALLLLAQLWLFVYVIIRGARSLARSHDYITIGFIGAIAGYLVQGVTGIATNELSIFLWFILGSTIAITSKEEMHSIRFQIAERPVLERLITPALLIFVMLSLFPLVVEVRYKSLANEAKTTMRESALQEAYVANKYCAIQPYYQYHLAELCLDFAREREDASCARLAVGVARRGLSYTPDSPVLLYILGSSYLGVAQYSGDERDLNFAGVYLNHARRKAPLFLGIYEDLLEFYMQKGNYGEALRCADFINSMDDKNTAAYVAQSVVYQLRGEDDEAQELFKKASALDPEAEEIKKRLIKASKLNNRGI